MNKFFSSWLYSPPFLLLVILGVMALVTLSGPAEKVLGANVRIVYLHGAWVWAALATFLAAAGCGLAGLALRREALHTWSRALGRTGLLFWISYLPISMWAMQTSWNGLYLAEPRWRLALIFAISGFLLQIGLTLLGNLAWTSVANVLFIVTLFLALANIENVMHPASPIYNSEAIRIQLFFSSLVLLCILAAWQVARWWRRASLPVNSAG